MQTPADRLRHARATAGFATASQAATRFGWNLNTYKAHENGKRGLKADMIARYAEAFRVSPAWIHYGERADDPGLVRNVPNIASGFSEEAIGTAPAATGPPDGDAMTTDVDLDRPHLDGLVGGRDLPVFGSALGGPDGEMIVSFEPIEWVRRPAPLEGVNGGFGFYMIGESMSPAFEPGDMILCHPTRPPYAGQDVLVIRRLNGGQCALVKRLVRHDPQGLRLRQFNPPEDFDVARDEVISFHLIVGKYSRR
ncbi:XRE family transcriptional regulator [Roseospira visakhapatnamensis]|uniref:Phage repressor protein C with HTH and peptisase S24 domain n=1 Tax=Roseospira visakhapatnamensis TaxID=390880 RepID=A0A7W6RAX1_9PROT|nr:S24 family peptidase [Roseospira visakhapatnamensis]MBB4265117.1 phage repressor protein C with HTH and peptisase S24 domain [Roseospira visakhapatnamensis]